ncbi:DUF4169 family protein [Xinfangfangia sp. CPCC 101601]|uniref:DUF4169 family protein n=1 Tax=Pseudogemmobacter lacusdianii TaxID=3069608 RepID=A0ABU0VTK1_9RHOB|nr:DUF4169 family protein [Xinfangfangia sp. CPCC 101601]MDQ2065057.1 DUF4169 family protein [Xinfangfangia sp. CPCC 101601]
MGELINLRQVKKQAARKAARSVADANAAKFGRSKAEKSLDEARADLTKRALDGHLRDKETD